MHVYADFKSNPQVADCEPPCPGNDQNVTVDMRYNADGNLVELIARNPETGDQRTRYVFGTTLADSSIASNSLLRATVYPDATDPSDRVVHSYNRQQQITHTTDQNGTVHAFDFDKLGRPTADSVVQLGQNIDGTVRRVETTRDARGLVIFVTNFNEPEGGNVVNQVQRGYNDFGQLTVEYQAYGGAVNTGTTPKVEYHHADGSANTARLESIKYPDGRELIYNYGETGSDDDLLSRVHSLDDGSGNPHVIYKYLGRATFVDSNSPEPGIAWSLITGDGANPYAALDNFGRVIDCEWKKVDEPSSSSSSELSSSEASPALAHLQYTYDRASNRTSRTDLVAPSSNDELYNYDGMQRLVDMARGNLTEQKDRITDAAFAQDWQLDATGNWSRFDQLDVADPSQNLGQKRSRNPVNEITAIDTRYGQPWATPQYDRAGNMTVIPKPADPTQTFTGTYDAWNRLVHLSDIDATYAYDGLNRRITKLVDSILRRFYYTATWQCLEERLNASTDPDQQYIWGLRYIDDLILRDRDTNSNGTLDERIYALQDANWNVVAIVNSAGEVQERYRYSPYGVPTVLGADFNPRSATLFVWDIRYAGYRWDAEADLHFVRFRYLHSPLGQWLSRDPIGYLADSINLFEYAGGSPASYTDSLGLRIRPGLRPYRNPYRELPPEPSPVRVPPRPSLYPDPWYLPNLTDTQNPGSFIQPEGYQPPTTGITHDEWVQNLVKTKLFGPDPRHDIFDRAKEDHPQRRRCRREEDLPPAGGNRKHNAFVERLQGHQNGITIKSWSGVECQFDGAFRGAPNLLFDAMTGYTWLCRRPEEWQKWQKDTVARKDELLPRCARVARECGYVFMLVFDNEVALKGAADRFGCNRSGTA